jgi:rubrerythrin
MTAQTAPAPTASDLDEMFTHLFCPICNPAPRPGDSVPALCGYVRHYVGHHLETIDDECPVCLAFEVEFQQTSRCPRCS